MASAVTATLEDGSGQHGPWLSRRSATTPHGRAVQPNGGPWLQPIAGVWPDGPAMATPGKPAPPWLSRRLSHRAIHTGIGRSHGLRVARLTRPCRARPWRGAAPATPAIWFGGAAAMATPGSREGGHPRPRPAPTSEPSPGAPGHVRDGHRAARRKTHTARATSGTGARNLCTTAPKCTLVTPPL